MTKWGRQRKAATEAGMLHADGGEDRRAYFASLGADVRDAYDKGYQNHEQDLARRAAAEQHPLRRISREAEALHGRADTVQLGDLALMVSQLADYILEREERNGA